MTGPENRPTRAHLAVLVAVSAAMLAFEVLLVRLFEFSHWHHFAGLTISLALLGLGAAGTFLAMRGQRDPAGGDGILLAGTAIQAAGILAVLLLHSQVAIRPLFAAWDARELAKLLLVDFAAFVPFFGAGLVIGNVFMRWPSAARGIYAANLIGSGAGSLAASGLLSVTYVADALALTALVPAVTLLGFALRRCRSIPVSAGMVCSAAALAAIVWTPAPAVSDFKALSQVLEPADARLLATRAGLPGRLTLVRSQSQRIAPGLSLNWTEPVPATDLVVIGSDRLLPVARAYPADAAYMTASLTGLPFQLRPEGRVLVLGTSAWQSPLAGAGRELEWVEPDRRLLDLAAGRGLAGPAAGLRADGAYRHLASGSGRFELITLDEAYSGGDAASEDYLMTIEGLAAALSRLSPQGLMALPIEHSVPPRRFPRALYTLRGALQRVTDGEPGRHVAVLRGLQALLVLASPQPLSEPDLESIRQFAEQWRFDLVWLPDLSESRTNRYHRLDRPMFHRAARAVFEGGELPQAARWFTTAAADFSRPYFWRSLSWRRIPDFFASMGRQRALSYLDWTLLLTAASALLAMLLAVLLIMAPLGRLPPATGAFSRASVIVYFGSLGLAYMLLELVVFQRAILFLGEPVVTAALVFAVFLIGSGLGSAFAPGPATRRSVAQIFLAIAAGLALSVMILWAFAEALLALPQAPRMAVMAAGLAPLTWAMGRAFPWALRRLAGHARWVPWAWAINGFASVVAAALATLISVQWGQPATLAAAIACYAAAAVIARRWVTSP